MKIEIWSDIACPYCYVGHLNLNAALDRLTFGKQVKMIHRAYQLNPKAELNNPLTAYESLAKRRNITIQEAKSNYDELTNELMQMSGLKYRYDILKPTNTILAHRVTKWARLFHKEHEVFERLYRAYFLEGESLGDAKTLARLLSELGFDPQEVSCFLSTHQFEELVYAEHEEAKIDRQIRGVPYYLINGKREIYGSESVDKFIAILEEEWHEENQPNVFVNERHSECCESEGCKLAK